MILPVTLVIAAAIGLINVWLALAVGRNRVSSKINLGDGGEAAMTARIRAHGNLTEYAPTVLILMALIELARGPSLGLWIVGAVFILVRLAHAFGIVRPAPSALRMIGALGTWVVIIVLAIWALAISYQAEWTPPVRSMQIGQPAA
ncbi:MAG TPA: MAPEG family protein [Sphingomonas sp.]|nr:MAPEG family protein [Sphingomonas sp.]